MNLTRTSPRHPATRLGVHVAAVTLLLIGGFALRGHPVSAATQNGVATITDPDNAQALPTGGSTTAFTLALPAGAVCSGDTANGGYHVWSYFVPKATSVASITFTAGPSTGFGLFLANGGNYYGPANTAVNTGQVQAIPNFSWVPLLTSGLTVGDLTGGTTSGAWDTGLVSATSTGAVSDWWNTQVTFTADAADANGFTWAATPGGGSGGGAVTPTTVATTPTTALHNTTTTKPPKTTTTTTKDPSPTTTTLAGATTTTVFSSTPTTVFVSGAGTGTDFTDPGTGGATFVDPSATGGTLPRTGSPVHRDFGLGLLAIGAGLMLVGLDLRWKARGAYLS